MDAVVGTAVLDRSVSPEVLCVLCKPEGKASLIRSIPVYREGTPKPQTKNGAAWAYREDGPMLHITPSLHCRSMRPRAGADLDCADTWKPENMEWQTDFHNGGSWSVSFVLFDPSFEYYERQVVTLNYETR